MAGKVGEWRGKLGNGGESWGMAGKLHMLETKT
jgi:hypothetical protein